MNLFNNTLKYIINYKLNSIIIKNFIVIMVILTIPFTIIYFNVYYSANDETKREIKQIINPRFFNIVNNVDNMKNEMQLLSYTLSHNKNIAEFMVEKTINNTYQDYDNLQSTIQNYKSIYKYIDSIYVYSDKNGYILSNSYNEHINNFDDKSWLKEYSTLDMNEISIVSRKKNNQYLYYTSFIQPVYLDPTNKIGAIVINVNTEAFSNIFLSSKIDISDVYVLDKYKKLIFCNKPDVLYNITEKYAFIYDQMTKVKANASNYLLYDEKSDSSELEYIYIVPLTSYKDKLAKSSKDIIMVMIFIISLTLVLSFYLSLRTFKPIGSIISILDDPEQESENINSVLFKSKTSLANDEVKYILNKIASTYNDKKHMELELEEKVHMLNNVYSIALQAQVNPHFLYNTLETINFMAYDLLKGNNKISLITTTLSQLLKIGLNTDSKIISLKDELYHVKLYIDILKIRYKNLCEFNYSISDDILECKVVKLMLQPIVENCFYHGIKPKLQAGKMQISAYLNNDDLIVEVEDNGIGISEDDLNIIRERLSNALSISSEHIGLSNVSNRIKMIFGENYGLQIYSEYGIGTKIVINLPSSSIEL